MIREIEANVTKIDNELAKLEALESTAANKLRAAQLRRNREELLAGAAAQLTAEDKVFLARHPMRPNVSDYIEALFDDFISLCGDRCHADDGSILGGIAFFNGVAVTVIGHKKGRSIEENLECNFGMTNPEGYRKALRLMRQAEKFKRPVITFVDTPGAFPGIEAEAGGQGEAIAQCLAAMSDLKVPIISIVTGEGGSGGALALAVADRLLMLEHAIFSILSPEGFASILWKDSKRSAEACELMKLTSEDLLRFKIADRVIAEPPCGVHHDWSFVFSQLSAVLQEELSKLCRINTVFLLRKRYQKLRRIGKVTERRSYEGD